MHFPEDFSTPAYKNDKVLKLEFYYVCDYQEVDEEFKGKQLSDPSKGDVYLQYPREQFAIVEELAEVLVVALYNPAAQQRPKSEVLLTLEEDVPIF